MRLPLLCVVALLTLSGCGFEPPPVERGVDSVQEGTSTVESGTPCVPVPVTSAELPASFPSTLPLPEGSELTDVRRVGAADLVSGRVEGAAAEVLRHFRDVAEPAGFAVVRDEDERRAGKLQLFGARSTIDITVAQLRCPEGSTSFTLQVQVP